MPYSIRLPDGTLVQNIPDEVTPQQAKAKILTRRPDLLTTSAPQPGASQQAQAQAQPEEEGTSNPFMGAIGRVAGLAGSGVDAIAEVAERLGDKAELAMPLSGISEEDIKNKKQLQPLFDLAQGLKNIDKSIGYKPTTELKDLAENPLNAVPFIAERILTSSPDMAAAVYALPAYVSARTKEILDERVKNDNKTLDDATVGDVTAALGAAAFEATFERFATKGLFKPTTAATGARRIGKEAGIQSGTEFVEEGVAYAGETVGTKAGFDSKEAFLRGLEGAIVGGGLGATVQGAKEFVDRGQAAPTPETPETPETPTPTQPAPEDVAAATEYVASITGPDDTNDASSEFHAEKLGIPLPPKDENYLDNLNAAIAARVSELQTPATDTTAVADADVDVDARIRQRADELKTSNRLPEDVAILVATNQVNAELGLGQEDAQTEAGAGVGTGDRGGTGVEPDGRPTTGGSVSVPAPPAPIQPTTPAPTGAESSGVVSDGTDVGGVGGGISGDSAPVVDVADVATQTATAVEQELAPTAEDTTEVVTPTQESTTEVAASAQETAPSSDVISLGDPVDLTANVPDVAAGTMSPSSTSTTTIERDGETTTTVKRDGETTTTTAPAKKPAPKTVEEQTQADEETLGSAEAQAVVAEALAKPKTKRGGKREGAGRKPADLTPEERAAKEKATSKSKADMVALKRDVDSAETELESVFDTTGIEALEGAERNRELLARETRLQAVTNKLFRTSRSSRGTKQGIRAKELLKQFRIPDKYIAEAKREYDRVELLGKIAGEEINDSSAAGSVNDTRQTVVGPVNDDIAKAKNAQQLLTVIAKKNTFFKLLAGRLRSFVAGVDVVVLETNSVLPAQLLRNLDSWNYPDGSVRATGLMVSTKKGNKRTIYLRGSSYGKNQGVNVVTALHEVLHAALDRKLKTGIDSMLKDIPLDKATNDFLFTVYELMDTAERAYTALKQNGMLPAGVVARVESSKRLDADGNEVFGVFEDPYEFLAHGLTEAPMQSFLKFLPGVDSRNAFTKFLDAIRKVLGLPKGETNALMSLVNVADTILRARQTKEMKAAYVQKSPSAQKAEREQEELDADVDNAIRKTAKSNSRIESAKLASKLQLLRDPRKNASALAEMVRGATAQGRKIILNAYTNDGLAAAAKASGLPSVEDVTNLIQRMHGMTGQMLEGAQDVMGNVYRAMKADPTLNDKLKEIVHVATLARVDPAVNKNNAKLNKMWEGLGENGQREYLRLRDYYKASLDAYTALLDKQIMDSGADKKEQTKLLAEIRKKFETESKIEPYFPLARFGEYWVSIGENKGDKKREFYMFETRAEQQALLKVIAEERKTTVKDLLGSDVSFGENATKEVRNEIMASSELKALFNTIDNTDFTGDADKARNDMKDAVYQMYLASMPQQNLRKQFQHRKDITGFETDILRSFAKTASGHAYQLSRVAYMQRISKSANAATKNAKNNEELMAYAAELQKRVALEMDSSSTRDGILNKIATYANRAAYLHFLSGVSSALLQPMQLLTVGFNVLGARHGYAAATKELMRTFKIWNEFGYQKKNADGSVSWVMPSIRYSKSMEVNTEERNALFDMLGTGVADETLNNEIVSRKNMPTEKFGTKWEQVKRGALIATTGLMHSTERVSREVMLLTSYRLSRAKGMSVEDAKSQAISDTYEGVGNMSSSNRPPIMRNPLGKVSLQFMMFPLYMASFLAKNFKRMIVPMNGQGRAEATKLFVGTMAATWVVAGSVGMPLFSMLTGFIGWVVNDLGDDDDDDMKTLKEMGFETWVRKVWLPELVGHETIGGYKISDIIERGPLNAVTGLDFSSRLSLNDMFVRDRKETRTTKEGAVEMAMGATGPFGAQVMSYMDAYDAFRQGDYQKAIEKSSPALIRNLALASKFANEGAKDFRGAELIAQGDYTTGMLIGQLIGFRSDKLANMQELGFKLSGLVQKINFDRTKLLNVADRVFRNNDSDGINSALDDIIKFNSQYPTYAISVDNILDSILKRATQRAGSVSGVILSEKNLSIPGVAEALQTVQD